MFEFFKKWFRPAQPAAIEAPAPDAAAAPTAAGTYIHYDPHLVQRLMAQHRELERQFGAIAKACGTRDAGLVVGCLREFGNAVREHLLAENVRFYVYLQHAGDPEQARVVHDFQHEMRAIGKALTAFLFRHTAQETWDADAWSRFEAELNEIGTVLTRRIATEENTLYPLYRPPR